MISSPAYLTPESIKESLNYSRLEIEGVSATSAGAMNTAVLAYGLLKGGPESAR